MEVTCMDVPHGTSSALGVVHDRTMRLHVLRCLTATVAQDSAMPEGSSAAFAMTAP